MRYIIGGAVVLGLVVGAILGSLLAVNIGNPLQRVTRAVLDLTRGERKEKLSEDGPEEIRILIQAVNTLVERLRSHEQSRQQLLSNLVHELGRPLGSLYMASQVLLQGSKDDPIQLNELLKGMNLELENLRHLLDDLSHLHTQVLGPLELNLQEISLGEWLPTILPAWEEAARAEGKEWKEIIPIDLPLVYIDTIRFSQIVGNLVSNALKYTPAGGTICIAAGEDPENVWLQVSDTGPGIAVEDLGKIFDPFFRGRQQTGNKEGMGLGLSITRDLVRAHQGTIDVDSNPGEGSSFTIHLPRLIKRVSLVS